MSVSAADGVVKLASVVYAHLSTCICRSLFTRFKLLVTRQILFDVSVPFAALFMVVSFGIIF